jgi:hypothetical protein
MPTGSIQGLPHIFLSECQHDEQLRGFKMSRFADTAATRDSSSRVPCNTKRLLTRPAAQPTLDIEPERLEVLQFRKESVRLGFLHVADTSCCCRVTSLVNPQAHKLVHGVVGICKTGNQVYFQLPFPSKWAVVYLPVDLEVLSSCAERNCPFN